MTAVCASCPKPGRLGPVSKRGNLQIIFLSEDGNVFFFFFLMYNYYKHKWDLALWNPENWAASDWWADGQWIKSFISAIEQLHTLDNRSQFSSAHKEVYQLLSACPAGVRRQITR